MFKILDIFKLGHCAGQIFNKKNPCSQKMTGVYCFMIRGVILLINLVNVKDFQDVMLKKFDVTVQINLVLNRN